jgi:hypothetical protein
VSADVTVLIETGADSEELFLVSVSTRHADFHLGRSHRRFEGLLPGNVPHRVELDFYLTLVGHGASVYHPRYTTESAITHSRSAALPVFRPRPWGQVLDALGTLSVTGAGAAYFRIIEHAEQYRDRYLPALDRAGLAPDPADPGSLQRLMEKADALLALPADPDSADRRTHARLQARRARVLPDIEKLLRLSRGQRLGMQEFHALTLGPKPMVEALLADPGFPALAAFVAAAATGILASGETPTHAWPSQVSGLRYVYRTGSRYTLRTGKAKQVLPCRRGSVEFDGRAIADGLYPDLSKSVQANFCGHPDGVWRLSSRWAP